MWEDNDQKFQEGKMWEGRESEMLDGVSFLGDKFKFPKKLKSYFADVQKPKTRANAVA